MFASLMIEEKSEVGALPVVCEFPDVFLDDISDLPPEIEVEFAIDVVP
ncbi:RNA-directed DNA polymerase (Reverse transcriptase), partial [Trifolium medium]|nr:RNA-directed DNA polymerase (Reverse transcriptase) [Trifolium medium]